MTFKGSKYDSRLDTVSIAKMVRSDLKQAVKDGNLPADLKVSVRTEKFSGGSALDATITAVPEGTVIHPPEWPEHGGPRYTPQVQAWLDFIKAAMLAYNRDDSDVQSDYFSTNFYHHLDCVIKETP